jgi:hypothetical protein
MKSNTTILNTAVRLYLDFDGTLTFCGGSQTISSALYSSLTTGSNRDKYWLADYRQRAEMIATLKEGLEKPENASMKMVNGALDFINNMIESKAEVVIVSRNRKEYIEALLVSEGLAEQQLNHIIIKDIKDLLKRGNKKNIVLDHEQEAKTAAQTTVVCDDDAQDFELMKQAIEENIQNGAQTALVSQCANTGTHQWDTIAYTIKMVQEQYSASYSKQTSTQSNLHAFFVTSPPTSETPLSADELVKCLNIVFPNGGWRKDQHGNISSLKVEVTGFPDNINAYAEAQSALTFMVLACNNAIENDLQAALVSKLHDHLTKPQLNETAGATYHYGFMSRDKSFNQYLQQVAKQIENNFAKDNNSSFNDDGPM